MAQAVRRPLGVTVLVVLTYFTAALDLLVGVALLVGASSGTLERQEDFSTEVIALVGVVILGLGVLLVVLAAALARGVNAARMIVTVLQIGRIGYGAFLVLGFGAADTARGLAVGGLAALMIFLLWNRSASTFFESGRETALGHSLERSLERGEKRDRAQRFRSWMLDFLLRLLVLAATIGLTPGIRVDSSGSLLVGVVMISLVGWALRPLLVRLAGLLGWLGALLLALFANAVVIGVALVVTPGINVDDVLVAFLASWVYALVMTLISWLFSINTQNYLVVHAARLNVRRPHGAVAPPPEEREEAPVPGVLFVQIDGMPAPVLENEIRSGNLPTISRWIRSGSHTWTEWQARVPSTTPVSQAGLLHGSTEGIPAFRWYERDRGRLMVANHPPDAAVIESRLSDGRGLLADDGVSISNLFSGDAPTSLLTMSGLKNRRAGLGPSYSYAAFFTHPAGFLRAVLVTFGEMVKEVFQGRRQVRRDVQPRVDRKGAYIALRGVTNGFLRDLNVALVVEAMLTGARSIYVDFVDYDEIAHHAGVTRPESLAALFGIDSVLASLEAFVASGATPRPYHVVLVSDHGQSQGSTFRQRYGQSLEEYVASLMSDGGSDATAAATAEVEAWGPVNIFLSQLSTQGSVPSRLTRRALRGRDAESALGPTSAEQERAASSTRDGGRTSPVDDGRAAPTDGVPPEGEAGGRPPLVVIGSGNLGGIWFARERRRLLLSDIERLHPGLTQSLASHPGVGFIVVMSEGGPVAVGAEGTHLLPTGEVAGTDPLHGFGQDAAAEFCRVAEFEHAPDIYVNSLYDPVLDEVAAFEELVGCHGGLGGWQTRPILVHPADWSLDGDLLDEDGRLRGAERVHQQLVRWLERLGHRQDLVPREVLAAESPAPVSD